MVDLTQSVQFIKGVGPSRVKLLNYLGIYTLQDLIEYYPRAYEDRRYIKKIENLIDGEDALIEAVTITSVITARLKRNMTLSKVIVSDGTDNLQITWFNQPYVKEQIKKGETYKFYGRVSTKSGKIEMNSPVFDKEDSDKNTGRILPVYPSTRNLNENAIRKIMTEALKVVDLNLEETIPEYIRKEYKLEEINQATAQIHFPKDFEKLKIARRRFVFQELLALQLALLSLKSEYKNEKSGIEFSKNIHMSDVINILPFNLTKAQLKVLEEIDNDMESIKPMNRLLQGDVGSGKTIVSIIAAYKAVKSGYQVAIMAPTTILAEQHNINFKKTLDRFGIKCELLVSSITKKNKEEILKRLKNGEIDILIGTHALLQENVEFKNLGLVVTDEQHRFGVKQRSVIAGKGTNPDILVMTATPIPRTLAIILYGDLDISIIDELPPNRKKIETVAVRKRNDRQN